MTYLKANLIVFLAGALLCATIYVVFRLTGNSLIALSILLGIVGLLNLLVLFLALLNQKCDCLNCQQQRLRQLYQRPASSNWSAPTVGTAIRLYGSCGVNPADDRTPSEAARTLDSSRSTASMPQSGRRSGTTG